MGFNLKPFGKIHEQLMYNDKCKVTRVSESKNQWGGTVPSRDEVVYEDKPCKFSFRNIDNPSDANENNIPVVKLVTLHISSEYVIVAGDLITGEHEGQIVEGLAGEPNKFEDGHQEVPISLDSEA